MERRLAVIMFADLVGYSSLMEDDQAGALAAIAQLKNKFLEPVAAEHGGEILKRMGDGWIVSFISVTSAIECAMAVQRGLFQNPVIKLRIGGHIGEIVHDETDFYGAGINLAQRLQTEAPPGGVMISQDVYRQLSGEQAGAFEDAGSFQLKNIALPVSGYQWRPQSGLASAGSDVPTIAVEAFDFAPDDSDTRAAAADLRDQLINRLARRSGVRILDEASGGVHDSDYLLRGRLRLAGGQGRWNVSLVERGTGTTRWSQLYDGSTANIFEFCDDLIEKANTELRIQINAFDGERIAHLPHSQLSPSELRTRAARLFHSPEIESWERSLRLLERALELNPNDPMALAMRAEGQLCICLARHGDLGVETRERLERDLDTAIEAAPRSDYVVFARGIFRVVCGADMAGARMDIDRCLALNPSYPWGQYIDGLYRLATGDFAGAADAFARSASLSELDPMLPIHLHQLAISQICGGHYDAALKTLERALNIRSRDWAYRTLSDYCHRQLGQAEGGEAVIGPWRASIYAPRPILPESHANIVQLLAPPAGA